MHVRTAKRRLTVARLRLELLEDRSMLDAGFSGYLANGEPNWTVSIQGVPNDTNFGSLWGMNNTGQTGGIDDADIDAAEAWDITTGSTAISVGVIDTGIDYTHPDLYLNIWLNQGEVPTALNVVDTDADGLVTFRDLNNAANQTKVTDFNSNGYIDAGDLLNDTRWENGVDNDANGYRDDLVGWDFVNNDNDPMDDNNHGTHVAGTIGGMGNNSRGVAGVNWVTQMAALKFLSASGSGSIANAELALKYATAKGIKITNNSWGGGGFSSTFSAALDANAAAGYLFVAAAGNSNQNNDAVSNYPSNYTQANVVAVAATTASDVRSGFSSFGATTVDLAAPGSAILSTTRNNTYSSFDGTSMATPHVAGAMALLWGNEPGLTAAEVIARIYSTVDVKASLSGLVATGGRLNINNALAAGGPDVKGPRVIAAAANGTGAASKVTVTFNEPVNPATFTTADIISFIGPTGALTVTGVQVVSGSNNTKFDLQFANQTVYGNYTIRFGPTLTDMSANANLMNQDNDANNGETPDDVYTAAFTLSNPNLKTYTKSEVLNIRDRNTVSQFIDVPDNVTVGDINVKVNINHTWDSDLRIYLVSPDNRISVNLAKSRGGSGDNFTNTFFDDEATNPIANGTAPFTANFKPDMSLSAFDGISSFGKWKLYIQDTVAGDVGKLNSWTLEILASAGGSGSALEADGGGDSAPVVTEAGSDSFAPAKFSPAAAAAVTAFAPTAATTGDSLGALALYLTESKQAEAELVTPSLFEEAELAESTDSSTDHRRDTPVSLADLFATKEEDSEKESLFAAV